MVWRTFLNQGLLEAMGSKLWKTPQFRKIPESRRRVCRSGRRYIPELRRREGSAPRNSKGSQESIPLQFRAALCHFTRRLTDVG